MSIDVIAQIFIAIAFTSLGAETSDGTSLVGLGFPLAYSAFGIFMSASPGQRVLGLRGVPVAGGRVKILIRIARACILKFPYFMFLSMIIVQGIGLTATQPSGLFLLLIVASWFCFAWTAQNAELGKSTFYDAFLGTMVVRRNTKLIIPGGFDVILQADSCQADPRIK